MTSMPLSRYGIVNYNLALPFSFCLSLSILFHPHYIAGNSTFWSAANQHSRFPLSHHICQVRSLYFPFSFFCHPFHVTRNHPLSISFSPISPLCLSFSLSNLSTLSLSHYPAVSLTGTSLIRSLKSVNENISFTLTYFKCNTTSKIWYP